jgi:hypothetical protein
MFALFFKKNNCKHITNDLINLKKIIAILDENKYFFFIYVLFTFITYRNILINKNGDKFIQSNNW